MAPQSRCPRCQTVVDYLEGTKPTCHVCGYPGADLRPTPSDAGAAAWTGDADVPAPTEPPTHEETRTSGKAVAALVLGIASYVIGGIVTAIIGLVLAISARKEIDASGGTIEGRGMAVAGFWLSLINLILGALAIIVFILVFAVGLSFAGAAAT